jgi:hypothetical protein
MLKFNAALPVKGMRRNDDEERTYAGIKKGQWAMGNTQFQYWMNECWVLDTESFLLTITIHYLKYLSNHAKYLSYRSRW